MDELAKQNQNPRRELELQILAEYNQKLEIAMQRMKESEDRMQAKIVRRERMFQLVCALVSREHYPEGMTESDFWDLAARILDAEPTNEAE